MTAKINARIALALVSALSVTALLPATAMAAPDRSFSERAQFNATLVLSKLRDRGVEATSVEQWNGYIRAYVTQNGVQVMQFFDPTTLEPVNI